MTKMPVKKQLYKHFSLQSALIIQTSFFQVGGHYLRGSQLWNFPAGRQASEKSEAQGPHDSGAALECRQSHSAIW